jgi:hypothetical protein
MELQNNSHLDRSYRIARLVAVMLLAGQLIYLGVLEFLASNPTLEVQPLHEQLSLLRPLFYGMAVVLLLVSRWLRNRLLGGGAALRQMVVQILDPQARQQQMVKAVQVAMTVAGIPGVLAVVLFLLGGERTDCYPLLALAALGQLLLFPRRSDWERWYAQRNAFR